MEKLEHRAIITEPIDSRNGNSFNFFDVDVGAMFKTGALFTARGFSYSTIKALVRADIDAPERLLFADGADLLLISGLDEQAFREIARYRRAAREASPTFPRPRRVAIDQPRAPASWFDDPSPGNGRCI